MNQADYLFFAHFVHSFASAGVKLILRRTTGTEKHFCTFCALLDPPGWSSRTYSGRAITGEAEKSAEKSISGRPPIFCVKFLFTVYSTGKNEFIKNFLVFEKQFEGIVSRDFVVCFLVSFDRSHISTHQEWVLLLLKVFFRFSCQAVVSLLCE
jgi:hypothetical protein